jgi:hypothetical protein
MVQRNLSTDVIDKRIAAERVRIVRQELDRQGGPSRAAALEITASRKGPEKQSANIVYDDKNKPVGFKVPPATFTGTPKMPTRSSVKNY